MAHLKFYNSLTRKKQEFVPINPDHVTIYACGPTVYNYAHIGNARMAVVFDLLARVLKHKYPKVTYVSNITDVDDKIIAASVETGQGINEITEKYTRIYNEDMTALGCALPDIQPRATAHIGDMIALIETLIERGHAYEADGHVLFNVPSFPAYGGLSGRSRDDQIAGARVEVASYKKDPADFVLWKPAKDDEPGWDSPWGPNNGRGRPGWHIECSAMAEVHLGLPLDIHGGGADLKFPHHENEIAQSCCAHGKTHDLSAFAKHWMHNGFVTVDGEKMSKSLGNFKLAHDLLDQYPGPVLRLALLSAHYRQPLDWGDQVLHQAQKLYDRMKDLTQKLAEVDQEESVIDIHEGIMFALSDDLNTPLAIASFYDLVSEIKNAPEKDLPALKSILHNSMSLLGIETTKDISVKPLPDHENEQIETLLNERQQARANKDFAKSDELRDQLAAQGIEVEDTPDGQKWRKL